MITRLIIGMVRSGLPLGLLLLVAPAALADVSEVIFYIEAVNGTGSDSYSVSSGNLVPDPGTGGQQWVLPAPVYLGGVIDPIAILNSATLSIVEDPSNYPRIFLNYEIRAGSVDAEYAVRTPLISFWPLPADLSAGRANASFTLTDFNDGVPAVLQSLDPNPQVGMYTAYYNGMAPAGTQFASLIDGLSITGGASTSASASEPSVGFGNIGEAVTDISFETAFTFTANDLMSGNHSFIVTPEPGTLGLMALVALGVIRRR